MWTGFNEQVIKDVCRNCDSPVSKKSLSYILYMKRFVPAEKVICECYGDRGFFFAIKGKNHARLVEIAVRNEYKGNGIGKELLRRLLQRMISKGVMKLTFRTPIDEPAQDFWTHI